VASWPDFQPDALLSRLVAQGVDFVVIGGVAMIGQGSARNTRDLDIVYAVDPANLEALGELMVSLGAKLRGVDEAVLFVPDTRTLRQTSILALDTPLGWMDLLVSPAGSPAYAQLRARADRITVDGTVVLIASLDDLESMKRAAGRPKDLLDLEEIEVIRRLRRQLRLR
jgi:hypothetical protein